MCLRIAKGVSEKMAEADIICYKILRVKDNGFETPYRYFSVVIGNTYHSDLNGEERTYYIDIEEGLHSFADASDAEFLIFQNENKYPNQTIKFVMAKCIIPKGSLYYKGKFNYYDSYASDCIRYEEIIKN